MSLKFVPDSKHVSLAAQLVKNLPAMREIWVGIPGLGSSPGEGKGYRLQYSGLENSTGCIVHGVTKSQTWLSHFHFHVIFVHTPSCVQNILLNIKGDNNEGRKE